MADKETISHSGWRAALGWVGVMGAIHAFIIQPIFVGLGIYKTPLSADLVDIIGLVTLLLGHCWIRSRDKKNGTARN